MHPHLDLNWHLKVGSNVNKNRFIVAEVDETFGRCRLAANGIGIISVPSKHPDIQKYNLVEILSELKGPACSYHIIIEKGALELKRIRVLKETMLNFFK